MTFTQIQNRFIRVLRAVRKVYRTADTAGEKLERELDRLIKRQHGQLIQPDDLKTAIERYNEWQKVVNLIPRAFSDALTVLQLPVVA
jgi:hypothetical protein